MTSRVLSARAPVPTTSGPVPRASVRALIVGVLSAPGLPAGTRVQLRGRAALTGTVMSYQRECSPGLLGLFPVRLDNAICQTCHAGDVIVLAPPKETPSGREVRTQAEK